MHRNLKSFHFKKLVSLLTLAGMFGITGCQELTHFFPATGSSTTRELIAPSTILVPEPQNTQFLDVLGIRADTQLSQCRNLEECNQAHFLKALTTLHSNTKVAGYHFQKIIESSPHHRLSQASRVWLWLLDEIRPSKSQPPSAKDITRELVQALIQRDLALLEELPVHTTISSDLKPHLLAQEAKVKALGEHIHELSQEVATLKTESASMHSLQQDLEARDKKVAELTSQLDALRRIDQELKEKAPPTTPSEHILTPKEEPRDSP
jgi:polyhydroxyalkanoate synthesis regulator phasin